MLLGVLSVIITLAAGYALFREGIFTAFCMMFNVFMSGIVAFNFWEPLARMLEPPLSGSFLQGFEDFLILIALFSLTFGFLRTTTNYIANNLIEYAPSVQSGGAAVCGLVSGYLMAGFLVCALQTLPWHKNFMGFDATYQGGSQSAFRRVLPPDRVWLALMYRAGAYALNSDEDPRYSNAPSLFDKNFTFDKFGTFEMRYEQYRRFSDGQGGEPPTYSGELDMELAGPSR
jgi:hypothetical protein